MIRIGQFGTTTHVTATTESQDWQNPGPYSRFCVMATVNVNLRKSTNADYVANGNSITAETTDFLLQANEYVEVGLLSSEWLAWIVNSGDTDGDLYITPMNQI